MPPRFTVVRSVLVLGVSFVTGACAKIPDQTAGMRAAGVEMSGGELRTRNVDLSRQVAAVIEAAADSMRGASTDATVRANALRWKTYVIPQVREAGLRPDPLVGVLDLSTLLAQLEQYFTRGGGRTLFGDQQPVAVAAVRALRADARRLSLSVLAGQDSVAEDWGERVDAWVADHPITTAQYTRPTPIGEIRVLAGPAGGLGGVVASMENELRLLQERLAFAQDYVARDLAWRTTLGLEEAAGTETLDSLRALVVHSAALMGNLPDLVAAERAALMDALAAERLAVMREILEHRRAVLTALGTEREAAMQAVSAERAVVLEALAAERAAVLTGADSIIQRGLDETRSIIDHVLLILILAGGAALVMMGVAAFVVVRYGRPAA